MPTNWTSYTGACHCGAVKISLKSTRTPQDIGARACQCSFCRLHGASWASDPTGELQIDTQGHALLYKMGTRSAEFVICANCGVASAATWICDDGRSLAVFRAECMEERSNFLSRTTTTDFSDETPELRFARRSRTWTPLLFMSK
jgi:hypothetical protein